MGADSKIEWTDASWTPIRARHKETGKNGWHCEHVTEGCSNCYAESMNKRLGTGLPFKPGYRKDIEIFLDEKMLLAPLRWKKPRMIFVCSMTDAFADFVKDEWLDRMFAVMALCPQHTFQVLTKRPERMREYLINKTVLPEPPSRANNDRRGRIYGILAGHGSGDYGCTPDHVAECMDRLYKSGWPLPNVWGMVSAEDQPTADLRVPILLDTPLAVRGVSYEPALGPVAIGPWLHDSDCDLQEHGAAGTCTCSEPREVCLDWIIVGGESGPRARPMHPQWARSVRDQCKAAGVEFFFKQWGAWAPSSDFTHDEIWARQQATVLPDGRMREWQPGFPEARLTSPDMRPMTLVGKLRAGRLLDGVEHNGMPRHG